MSDFLSKLKLNAPEAVTGSTGAYHLIAKSEDGDKLFMQIGTAPCVGRKDGQSYRALGLLVRFLYAGSDPVLPEGFESREKKAYKKFGTDDDIYCTQLNKMLWPVATINIGSEALMEALEFHYEALAEIVQPLIEKNKLEYLSSFKEIFEALNPHLMMPVINFEAPKTMLSWKESLEELKKAAGAAYKPKNESGTPPAEAE